jgi:hypothetical protein
MFAGALRTAVPHVRVFVTAASQISCLVEMAADDVATRRAHRLTLAAALLALLVIACPLGTPPSAW